MAYHVIHGLGVTFNIIPYAELLVVNELYGVKKLWRTLMCPLEGHISKLLAGRQFIVPKIRSFYIPLFKMIRQTHEGYYG